MTSPSLYIGKEIHELPNISYSQNNDYYVFERVNEINDGITYKISRLNLFKDFVFIDFSKYDYIDSLVENDTFLFNRNAEPFKTTARDILNFVLDLSHPFIFEKQSVDLEDWIYIYDDTQVGEKKCKVTFKTLIDSIQTKIRNPKIKVNVIGGVTGTSGGSFIELGGVKTINIQTTVLSSSHNHDGRYAPIRHTHPLSQVTDYLAPNLIAGKGIKIEGSTSTQQWIISELLSVSDIQILGGFGINVTKVGTVWTLSVNTDAITIEAGYGISVRKTGETWTISNTDPGSGINIVAGPNVRVDRLGATEWKIVSLLHAGV